MLDIRRIKENPEEIIDLLARKGKDARETIERILELDNQRRALVNETDGLKAKQKFLLQLVVAIAFVFLMRKFGYATPNLYIPFWNITVPIPEVVYFIFAAFIIVGCVNAVNLTDGVDGLATGTTLPVMLCYAVVAFRWGQEFLSLGIFASGMFGALMGFLLYNFNPAKVFMGDTGSLFLGGAVCGMAFAMDMPLVLIPLGIIYIAETLSDIIQVLYFKISHGKRIFKMAPLHHHLEMGGWTGKKWSEKDVRNLFPCAAVRPFFQSVVLFLSFIGVAGRYVM